jgi:hypothetical protein
MDLNLTPDALKVPIPRYLAEERAQVIQSQRELLVHALFT